MYEVHVPIQAKAELVKKYEEKAQRLGLDKQNAIEEGEFFPTEDKKTKRVTRRRLQSHPAYAAMVETVDRNVGRVLAALTETNELENTIIFFTSDNGGLSTAEGAPTCNAPYAEGKGWGYEGGIREPLLVRAPGITKPGSVSDAVVTSTDFFPTMLDLADLPLLPQHHQDGISILPALKGGSLDREAIYWHYPHYGNQGGTPCAAVRSGDWKLIEFYEDWRVELYNLKEDVSETRNIAAENPEIVKRLRRMLAAWRFDAEALLPQPNPDFIPWR
jgi:arylsulfatase A-like enzyme